MSVKTSAINQSTPEINPQNAELWQIGDVLVHFPVSKSTWLNGVRDGRYPAPVRLSPKRVAWRSADIRTLIASL